MPCFAYGAEAVDYLTARDPALARVIREVGEIRRPVIPDLFAALVNTIVGQQISTKAHQTIWRRMEEGLGEITPQRIAGLSDEELQGFGLSFRKVGYIKNIAGQAGSGELDLAALQSLPDEEVCRRLCRLDGIGQWSAEMLLIFSLQRPDVLSYGDLAIQRGLRMVYRHRAITPALFGKYRRRYSPYATVAGLYLWAAAGGQVAGLTDPAPKPKKNAKPSGPTGKSPKAVL